MSDRGTLPVAPPALLDPDYGVVLNAYLQLPLFSRQQNGSWVVPLRAFKACELRLVETVPERFGEPILRVQLLDLRSQSVIESRECVELEEAVVAFKAMIPAAEAYGLTPNREGRDRPLSPKAHDRLRVSAIVTSAL